MELILILFLQATDRVGEELDPETRDRVVKEGVKVRSTLAGKRYDTKKKSHSRFDSQVFELNNSIISSVSGVDDIFRRRVFIVIAVLAVILALFVWRWNQYTK